MSATASWSLEANAVGPGPVRVRRAGRSDVVPRGGTPSVTAAGSHEGSRPGELRLTRRGRVVVGLAACLLACAGVVATGSAQAGSPQRGVEVTRHVVEPGETLWALARSVAQPREDLRDVVIEIEKLNDLTGAGLRAGEELLLPAARG